MTGFEIVAVAASQRASKSCWRIRVFRMLMLFRGAPGLLTGLRHLGRAIEPASACSSTGPAKENDLLPQLLLRGCGEARAEEIDAYQLVSERLGDFGQELAGADHHDWFTRLCGALSLTTSQLMHSLVTIAMENVRL
jgi:hypothetical protein